jgi:hypothetical protein
MTGPVHHRIPLLMYGILLVCLGIAMYLFGVLIALSRHLLGGGERLLAFNEWIVWYSEDAADARPWLGHSGLVLAV